MYSFVFSCFNWFLNGESNLDEEGSGKIFTKIFLKDSLKIWLCSLRLNKLKQVVDLMLLLT